MSEDLVELTRRGFDAYRREGPRGFADFVREQDLLHPDFLVHIQEDLPNGGDWVGLEGYERMSAIWLEAWEQFELEPHDFVSVDEDSVLVPLRQSARARGSGIEVGGEFFYVFLFKHGKLQQLHLYADREPAERAATRAASP